MARDASKSKPRGSMGKPTAAAKAAHQAHKTRKTRKPLPGPKADGKAPQKGAEQHASPAGDLAAGNLTQVVAALQADKSVRWFEVAPKLKGAKREEPGEPLAPTDELVVTLKKRAQRLLEAEVARFDKQKSGKMSSDDKYLATMMKSGTLSDRVASLTLTVQASPFHSLLRVGQLISMASKKARRESLMAVDSLKDLFLNNLLPDDRKLRFFHQHPLRLAQHSPAHLVLWFFEHCLKTAYAQLCNVLAAGMDDAVDSHKRACLRAASALLRAKPEQEAVLLAMLVNKLGDPDRKIAAYLHRMLQDVLKEHPAMKRVVVDEVERLLTRAKVSDRAKYNAVLFLNQLYLDASGDDVDLAGHLISVYFGLFSKEVHGLGDDQHKGKKKSKKEARKEAKKGTKGPADAEAMDRKLLSSLLVGVNRAFPYAQATAANFTDEMDALFEVVHRAHHSTSVQALMLLFQVMSSTNSVSDRFYIALYAKLADAKLRETSKHTLFLNLVFRAMKADVSPPRCCAFTKRLLQLATVMPPAFACAVLFLLSELLKVKPQLRTMLDQPEAASAGGRHEDEHFADVQTESPQDAFALEKEEDDDDGSETLEDTPDAAQDDGLTDAERSQKVLEQMFGKTPAKDDNNGKKTTAGVVSFDDEPSTTAVAASGTKEDAVAYDPTKRNPLYAGAETSCAWELHLLVHHYHPSVEMFARQLLENKATGIQYAGDPLVDFTLHAFFEKFVNKKPRHKATVGAGVDGDAQARAKSWTFAPINSEAVLQESEAAVDASDQFFYKFFKERASRDAALPGGRKKKKRSTTERDGDALSDVEEEEDDEMEAYAQQLAEGIMEEGNLDDEDPDTAGWSDGDDEEGDDDLMLDGEDDADAIVFGDDEAQDDVQEDEDEEDGDDEDEEDEEDEDGFDFSAMGGMDEDDEVLQEELQALEAKRQKQTPPKASAKRKSPFASADNYEQMVRDALAKQKQKDAKPRGKKKPRRA